ncbi:T9SS type A sorting domain-containing protein [Polaribacter pectinis]|uniref:T9SS type A sorting domain-containing protein n=1 Tax=Polaribacter pectinis TaxID=2738844 RepID=A0A7G9L6S0_9FLAO|nr:T9SS type A sorting domain-containing protein [Polaribacter pectinis]QNM84319.1 T9SS type A sorting domain-containing protein [Polaribacter pectinis]
MKKITILWLLLVLPSIIFSQNLISNQGLEDGVLSPFSSSSGGVSTPSAGEIYSGTYSMNLGNDFRTVKQNFTATSSTKYQLSFYARYNNSGINPGGEAFVTIRLNDGTYAGNGNVGTVTAIPVTTTSWTHFTYTFTAPQSDLMFHVSKNARSGGGVNNSIRFDNISVRPLATWDGSSDSNWDTAANWDINTVPTFTSSVADYDIVLPSSGVTNEPIISATTGAFAYNLEVDGSRTLTINGGGSLDVDGTSTGNITYNRTLVVDKWHLVGSPVVGQSYNDTWVVDNNIASGTGNNRGIATFQNGAADPTTGQWVYLQSGGSGTFNSSTGYALRSDTGGAVSFTGTYPTGSKPATVSNANANKFNLVSNPFPTYLAVSEFFTNNGASKFTENTIWIWNQASGAYVPKTSTSDGAFEIAPGQAFFISSGDGTQIEFYQFNGGGATDTFLKNSRTEISLSVKQGGNIKSADLHYINNGTNDFDNGYDASLFGGVQSNFNLYTGLINNSQKKLARQVLSLNDIENIVIPVGLKVSANAEITFTADAQNLPNGINVYLEDRTNNTFTQLNSANAEFKFTPNKDIDGIGRFYLHVRSSALSIDGVLLESVSVFAPNNSTLRILGLPNGNTNVKMFNILGKQVLNNSFSAVMYKDIDLPYLTKGVYIVQLETAKGKLNKKIILE